MAPTAIRKSLAATIDSALSLNELIQRFGMIFVLQRVPQNSRPFGAGTLVYFGRIGCAADDYGERLLVIERTKGT